ncbi:uncharacterized protein LOC119109382 [Pollicipes pollicipes]|uniref:uncharacterized protein LOC119109382 n=1 Tax=Pollicipes pollicipes TaxID=41117 RepID=UPI0018858BCD|nr:uncharacterized protein LOC119109382 [Pollicipes pollicipes]
MVHRRAVKAVDAALRDVRESERPFGGLLTVVTGDWQQILPVIGGGGKCHIVDAYLKSSPLWQHVTCLTLRTNMSAQLQGDAEAGEYARFLCRLGSGQVPRCPYTEDHVKLLPAEPEHVYRSVDSMSDPDAVPLATKIRNGIELSGMPAHCIRLKAGAPVPMRNLDAPSLVNGSLCVTVALSANVLIITGPDRGHVVVAPRIPIESIPDSGLGFLFRRLQFPTPRDAVVVGP